MTTPSPLERIPSRFRSPLSRVAVLGCALHGFGLIFGAFSVDAGRAGLVAVLGALLLFAAASQARPRQLATMAAASFAAIVHGLSGLLSFFGLLGGGPLWLVVLVPWFFAIAVGIVMRPLGPEPVDPA